MAIIGIIFFVGLMFYAFTADNVPSGIYGMFFLGLVIYAGVIHPLMEKQKREERRQFAKERRKQREAENNANNN